MIAPRTTTTGIHQSVSIPDGIPVNLSVAEFGRRVVETTQTRAPIAWTAMILPMIPSAKSAAYPASIRSS